MSTNPNLDRFSCGVNPKIPIEVWDCAACGGMMYDFEVVKCLICDAGIHQGCVETCEGTKENGETCGQIGCRACLTENAEGLLLCENCRPEEEIEVEQTKEAGKAVA